MQELAHARTAQYDRTLHAVSYLGHRMTQDPQRSKQQTEAQRVPCLNPEVLAFKVYTPACTVQTQDIRLSHQIQR